MDPMGKNLQNLQLPQSHWCFSMFFSQAGFFLVGPYRAQPPNTCPQEKLGTQETFGGRDVCSEGVRGYNRCPKNPKPPSKTGSLRTQKQETAKY